MLFKREHFPKDPAFHRAFALALAQPVYSIRPAHKTNPFYDVDFLTLFIKTIEFCLDSMGLGSLDSRMNRETLEEKVFELLGVQISALAQQDGYQPPDNPEINEFAHSVVNALLNIDEGRAFSTNIFSYDQQEFVRTAFYILEETEGDDGKFYIQPSIECINLYLNALSLDFEDRTIAHQALLEHQLKTGKIRQASQTAEEHHRTSVQQMQTMANIKNAMRTNVYGVKWKRDVLPLIETAEKDISRFQKQDDLILRSIEQSSDLNEEDNRLLAKIERRIRACITVYAKLQEQAARMAHDLREAQDHQSFTDHSIYMDIPSFQERTLPDLMKLNEDVLPSFVDDLVATGLPPVPVPTMDLDIVISQFLRERRVREEREEFDPHDTTNIEVFVPNISPEDKILAEKLLEKMVVNTQIKLSEAIAIISSNGHSQSTLYAFITYCHMLYCKDDLHDRYAVLKDTGFIEHEAFIGSDLLIVHTA